MVPGSIADLLAEAVRDLPTGDERRCSLVKNVQGGEINQAVLVL